MIPFELRQFLINAGTTGAFRTWLYGAPELIEPWLSPADYLEVLELEYTDRASVNRLREKLRAKLPPIAPIGLPLSSANDDVDALMNAIRRAPDDPQNYLVLGDHLQQLGDPRGALIALHASSLRGGSYPVQREETALLDAHADALYGPAFPFVRRGVLRLEWFLGFVARAKIICEDPVFTTEAIQVLFRGHPSFELLREVELARGEDRYRMQSAIDELAAAPPSSLASLRIGSIEDDAWNRRAGDLSDLWAAHPRLRTLEINNDLDELGSPHLPDLLALEFYTRAEHIPAYVSRIFEGALPSLERLSITTALFAQDASSAHDLTMRLPHDMERALPKLRSFCFRVQDVGPFWEQAETTPLLSQLHTLETNLTAHGLRVLRDHAPRFRHLSELMLHAIDPLRPGEAAELKRLLPQLMLR